MNILKWGSLVASIVALVGSATVLHLQFEHDRDTNFEICVGQQFIEIQHNIKHIRACQR